MFAWVNNRSDTQLQSFCDRPPPSLVKTNTGLSFVSFRLLLLISDILPLFSTLNLEPKAADILFNMCLYATEALRNLHKSKEVLKTQHKNC